MEVDEDVVITKSTCGNTQRGKGEIGRGNIKRVGSEMGGNIETSL
jgi:hypothetical protein